MLQEANNPNDSLRQGASNMIAIRTIAVLAAIFLFSGVVPAETVTADPSSPVSINEVESNGGVPGDWVELINTGLNSVDVSGWRFLDNDNTHVAYVLPPGSSIPAGGYLLLEEAAFGFGLGSADSAR